MSGPSVAVVIPALNEEATVRSVIEGILRYATPIVIDDGSTDATAEVARSAGATLVRHDRNRGYDAAINTGFAEARRLSFDVVLTMDADGQHNAAQIGRFVNEIERGADVVVGIRPRRARLAEKLFALITRVRYGIVDPLCGMKAYRMRVYDSLGHFDSYGSVGTELLLHAQRTGFRIAQIPVEIAERADRPRFGSLLRANWRILRGAARAF